MALYTADLRGTVRDQQWALHMHYLVGNTVEEASVIASASDLAPLIGFKWITALKPITPNVVTLSKVVVKAVAGNTDEYEFVVNENGVAGQEACSSFVAYGFRQFKAEVGYRIATHRYPVPLEENVQGDTWISGNNVDLPMVTAAAHFFDTPVKSIGDTDLAFPVIIRTRKTVKNPDGSKTTTVYTPPHATKVTAASFYGVSSQVSRKKINKAG